MGGEDKLLAAQGKAPSGRAKAAAGGEDGEEEDGEGEEEDADDDPFDRLEAAPDLAEGLRAMVRVLWFTCDGAACLM
jgi:hypothetical protein